MSRANARGRVVVVTQADQIMQVPEFATNVVVGSGFGGSVMAYRLADAGEEVCLLERGKAYAPGDFPRDPRLMGENLWDPSNGRHGLFDIWSFHRLDAVVSSALGGGSMIYANVLLRKPPDWFQQLDGTPWPITYDQLDKHYGAVEAMLEAEPFPVGMAGFESVMKSAAMTGAADELRWHSEHPKLAVAFRPSPGGPLQVGAELTKRAYPNFHGLPRRTCTLCGQCDLGCNTGSKNTLDHTYLSAAQDKQAAIFTRCEVRSFEPDDAGGYLVRYVYHDPGDETGQTVPTRNLPVRTIRCKRLILAAGTLGTTFLLLRMRRRSKRFRELSPLLGHHFSGNGDYLGVLKGARLPDGGPKVLNASAGPVVTTAIRLDDEPGGWIQDAGYPVIVDWLIETGRFKFVYRVTKFAAHRWLSQVTAAPKSNLSGDVADLIGKGSASSATMPLLGMGNDVPDGVMKLRNDRYLALKSSARTSQPYVRFMERNMNGVAHTLHARFKRSAWSYWGRSITVHPLGGCPVGTTSQDGVVDEFGEVFGYPNLFVVDGAAMPGPVGSNPSLTIAAFADRAATAIAAGRAGQG
jgi:cholesterol oxidase